MDEYEEENEDDMFVLGFDDDGNVTLNEPSDFVEIKKDDFELINGFLNDNKEDFKKYCDDNKEAFED